MMWLHFYDVFFFGAFCTYNRDRGEIWICISLPFKKSFSIKYKLETFSNHHFASLYFLSKRYHDPFKKPRKVHRCLGRPDEGPEHLSICLDAAAFSWLAPRPPSLLVLFSLCTPFFKARCRMWPTLHVWKYKYMYTKCRTLLPFRIKLKLWLP